MARNKYGAVKTEVDGIVFDSKREAQRYRDLSLLQSCKEISALDRQVDYPIVVNGVKVSKYVADFVYQDRNGKVIIEDSKGFRTPVYRLKKKLVEALYGVKITEV